MQCTPINNVGYDNVLQPVRYDEIKDIESPVLPQTRGPEC